MKNIIKAIKEEIETNRAIKEYAKRENDIIRFTVKDTDGTVETFVMDRLGYSNYMIYCYDVELISAECIKRA